VVARLRQGVPPVGRLSGETIVVHKEGNSLDGNGFP